MFIMSTIEKHTIGSIITYGEVSDYEGVYHKQPFVVLRECTKQEFIDSFKEDGVEMNNHTLEGLKDSDEYYYEISMD